MWRAGKTAREKPDAPELEADICKLPSFLRTQTEMQLTTPPTAWSLVEDANMIWHVCGKWHTWKDLLLLLIAPVLPLPGAIRCVCTLDRLVLWRLNGAAGSSHMCWKLLLYQVFSRCDESWGRQYDGGGSWGLTLVHTQISHMLIVCDHLFLHNIWS